MNLTGQNDNEDDTFIFEEIDKYKLTIVGKGGTLICTGNDIEKLLDIYNEAITIEVKENECLIVSIYDYDKNTDIYYYNSDDER